MTTFRILVVSDLHLHNGDSESGDPSYLSSLPTLSSPTLNPISGIPDLLVAEHARPDWILCPGDLGDKCDQLAQKEAWQLLERLRRKTHARKLIGTVGNHDVDSRRISADRRPNDFLIALEPTFPVTSRRGSDQYWRENFVCIENEAADLNLIVVNSCEFHGIVPASGATSEESVHGRLSNQTVDKLARFIRAKSRPRNILLVHHHIRQHPWLPRENSHMENGPALLEVLKASGKQWLVIHGHQHLPNLSYFEGGATAPIVFSAGSVAAPTTVIRAKHPRNQLYCIELEDRKAEGVEFRGRVRAWDWFPHVGWQRADKTSGLPHSCGFGYRGPLGPLVDKILLQLNEGASGQLRWPNIVAAAPDISYLIPDDIWALVNLLESRGALVDFDRCGMPSLVGIRKTTDA